MVQTAARLQADRFLCLHVVRGYHGSTAAKVATEKHWGILFVMIPNKQFCSRRVTRTKSSPTNKQTNKNNTAPWSNQNTVESMKTSRFILLSYAARKEGFCMHLCSSALLMFDFKD